MIKSEIKDSPREFELADHKMRDHGKIIFYPEASKTNELVAFQTQSGKCCEVAATSWGYYLGPSLNSRLVKEGFRAALMINTKKQVYVVAVMTEKMSQFTTYIESQDSEILFWFDEEFAL